MLLACVEERQRTEDTPPISSEATLMMKLRLISAHKEGIKACEGPATLK